MEDDGNSDYEYDQDYNEDEYEYDEDQDDEENTKMDSAPMSNNASEKRPSLAKDTTLHIPFDTFTVKYQSDVLPVMNRLVKEVSGLLDSSEDEAHVLLQHHKWDKEKLMDAFLADFEKTRKAAGLDLYSPSVLDRLVPSSSKAEFKDSTFNCRIRFCCEEVCPTSEAFSMGCGHRFCRACYAEYLRAQVQDGPACIIAKCPEHKCTQTITRSVYRHFLAEFPEERDKYESYVQRAYIETSKNMRYCPAPRCDKVLLGSGVTTVQCLCGCSFCFKCGEEGHDPASCTQLSEWMEKCMNESETANWILANTRKCPTCGTRIEKNQGCNHMSCRQCKHEFCWICMGNWSEHGQTTGGFYKCNRFDPTELPASVTEAQRAKAELDRYLHYYQRYHGHDQGLQFAEKLRESSERRMLEQQEAQRSSWMDVQFLKQAAEQVRDCRRVLKYTYVLGYFLRDRTAEKQLFEHHQEMLEKNTERLQEFTERPLDLINRADVVNLTRVTERFMQSLLQTMSGGVVRIDEATRLSTLESVPSSAAATASPSGSTRK